MITHSRLLAALCVSACLALSAFAGQAVAAAPAWSPIAATGPTVIPMQQNEVQKVFVDAEGGTFTLTARHLAASALANLTNGQVVGIVSVSSGAFAVGQTVEGLKIPQGAEVTALGAGTVTLSKTISVGHEERQVPIAGFDTPQTTAPLPFDATAAEVQSALEALSDVGVGNVEVSGGPGGHNAEAPYIVSFKGALVNTNVALLTPNGSSLTGGQGASAVTAVPGGLGTSKLALMVQNIGGGASAGTVTYTATLPNGITTVAPPATGPTEGSGAQWGCGASTPSKIVCTWSEAIQPSLTPPPINATIIAAPGTEGAIVGMTVEGGNAATATAQLPISVGAIPAKPGIQSFVAGAYDANGGPDTRAGGHPYSASAAIFANTVRTARGQVIPAGEFRDINVELPPGFLGNPVAVPACPEAVLVTRPCSLDTMVAVVTPIIEDFGVGGLATPVFNTEAPYGYPAKFRFEIKELEPLNVIGTLRSDGDFGLDAASLNTPQIFPVYGTFFTFWGEPASSTHDVSRCRAIATHVGCEASDIENTAFLTNATNCAEQASIATSNGGLIPTNLNVTLWQNPGEVFRTSAGVPPVTGCDQLHFSANFTFEPSDTKSDSPASFRSELTVPDGGLTRAESPCEPGEAPVPGKKCLTTPEIRETVVKLPEGVTLNPSGADGLQACSESQIGLLNEIDPGTGLPVPMAMPNPIRFSKDPQSCPEAAKIGTGELKSALLEDPLHGALYLAAQGKGNPFGSLFAIYLVIEDPRHGIFIKLPGEVETNKQTGQFQVTFRNLPQLPFSYLRLNLKGGNRSALASPTTCGHFVTTAVNTPWSAPESGPPTESSNGFDINRGPNGQACAPTKADRPFDLGLKAGSGSSAAGAQAPLTFQVTRPDGSQELNTLDLGTAPGLSAKLKGIPYCTATNAQIEARTGRQEEASPSCPTASQIGRTVTGAGAGPTPFYTDGKLYLAGPYKGAPLSVLAITPAVAGPFDLGNVVVRTAVFIDRSTAQVTAKTDPIPQILEGVPLRIKDVRVILDRNDFALNPTNCEPSAITLHATGNSGAVADLSSHFQVSGCQNLAFKPKLTAKVTGPTKRGGLPAFTAELTYPEGPGYANIKDVQVTVPHSEFLEQAHISTICTRVQAAAHACPQGSIYGYAEATTPLIDGVLKGPVFLKSSVHKLPDLAIALRGPDSQPVEVEFAGRIDSIHGQIRNTIEGLPDVPVSKFVLRMKGGRKGLLVNSRNLCQGKPGRMTVDMTAQNNKTSDSRPLLGNSCGKAKKKVKRRQSHKRSQRRAPLSRFVAIW